MWTNDETPLGDGEHALYAIVQTAHGWEVRDTDGTRIMGSSSLPLGQILRGLARFIEIEEEE